jgi:hypothetical protein
MMRRQLVTILVVGMVLAAAASAWPVQAQPGACQLAPVFAMLREVVGRERVGECTGAPVRLESGDLNQSTTRGTLTLRMGDLVPAFSDGQTTWLFGPRGLENRPSSSQLAWETGAGSMAVAQVGVPGTGSSDYASSPTTSSAVASSASQATGTGTGRAGFTESASFAPPAASPVPVAALPISVDGDGASTTRPFDLPGGNYVVAWEVQLRRGTSSCYLGARLRRFEDQNPGSLILHTTVNTSNDRSSDGETRIFNVTPGRYVMDVTTTGCEWKIELRAPG